MPKQLEKEIIMETRETKDRVDSIKRATQRISTNVAGLRDVMGVLVEEQKKTNETLEQILSLLRRQERRDDIKKFRR